MAQNTVRKRLEALAEYKLMRDSAFERFIGFAQGTIAHTFNSISPHKFRLVLAKMPEVNPLWLLLGEGEMLRSEAEKAQLKRLERMDALEKQVAELTAALAEANKRDEDRLREMEHLRAKMEVTEMRADTYRQIVQDLRGSMTGERLNTPSINHVESPDKE